jgi:hypothetical protein
LKGNSKENAKIFSYELLIKAKAFFDSRFESKSFALCLQKAILPPVLTKALASLFII